ncbi:MAG: hypothetical protein ACJ78Q_15365 [Chloroflexia bacterium]
MATGTAVLCSFAALILLLFAGVQARAALAGNSPPRPLTGCLSGWDIVPSPNTTGTINSLAGLAVVSSNDMWAVGYRTEPVGGTRLTLSEHWDGSNWTIVPGPDLGSPNNSLSSALALASNNVWAVGFYSPDGSHAQTLVEHWNGSAWSVVLSPNVGTTNNNNALWSVSALSPSDIWTVGLHVTDSNQYMTLIEHWDGVAWSVASNPNPSTYNNSLEGVAVVSANDVWAVGTYISPVGTNQTLIEHWNGSAWSVVPSPNVGTGQNWLWGVASLSANDAWAVGYSRSTPTGPLRTLVEHWNGASWAVVPSADPGAYSDRLTAVAALSPTDVWAVGYSADSGSSPDASLVERWDGTAWNVVPSPNSGSDSNHLSAVAAMSAIHVIAAGDHGSATSGATRTLIERYSEPCTPVLTAHVTWQGRPDQPSPLQQVPVTLTLRSATTEVNYPAQGTDPNGFFTVPAGTLPSGTYAWRAKGPKYLAGSGAVTLSGAPATSLEIGQLRAGDANNDNGVNSMDFTVLRLAYGKSAGQLGYDDRVDFTGDQVVNVSDFSLLRLNFGQSGAPPITP